MKRLFACLLLLFTAVGLSFGQVTKPSLSNDVNFKQSLLKLARYPKTAQEEGKVAKVYVDFKVDRQGRISEVYFLNNNAVDASFTEAVSQLMSQLPTQKSAYAGEYVLPVVFELEGKQGASSKLTAADRAAYDRTFVQLSHTKSLLGELYVTAYAK